VDAFQGREKEIILIYYFDASDGENPFGFVSNIKRLCVATTRAVRYQFMFGNLSFLQTKMTSNIKLFDEYPSNTRG
jgi:superfamily I DNA and/or RNA helicase